MAVVQRYCGTKTNGGSPAVRFIEVCHEAAVFVSQLGWLPLTGPRVTLPKFAAESGGSDEI